MRIRWSEDYETGIAEIDIQHKQLTAFFNGFVADIKDRPTTKLFLDAADYFQDWVFHHFETEEQFMMEYRYPEFESHRSEHFKILNIFDDIAANLHDSGLNTMLGIQAQRFLKLLYTHFMNVDKPMAGYFRSRVKSGAPGKQAV